MNGPAAPRDVVVGIDGSQAAIRAALWAREEALSRDVPLRLLSAADARDGGAAAKIAIRQAARAIDGAGKPVRMETEVVPGPPVPALVRASASAAMVCVGAVGCTHFRRDRAGSTAAALASSARCPVAIIRSRGNRPGEGIVVGLDGSPDSGALLGAAVTEARLRDADLRALIRRDRRALADLDRRLVRFRRRYPELRVEPVAVGGGLLEYLTDNPRPAALVVADAGNRHQLRELVGPAGCSVLVVNQRHL